MVNHARVRHEVVRETRPITSARTQTVSIPKGVPSGSNVLDSRTSAAQTSGQFVDLLVVDPHHGANPLAENGAHDTNPSATSPARMTRRTNSSLVRRLASLSWSPRTRMKPLRSPPWLEKDRLEALDLALLLEASAVLRHLVEHREALPFRPRIGGPKPMKSPKFAISASLLG